jgi:phosphoglycolate phosphatase
VTTTSIIFDLDGTLIDSEPGVKESFGKAVAVVFPHAKFDPAAVVIGPPLPKMFAAAYPQASEGQIEPLVDAFRAHYNEVGWQKTRLFDNVKETLASLHSPGTAIYVVTNKPLDISRKILRFFELDRYFEDVRSLDSVDPPYRNKTEMLRALVKDRNLKPEQCVFIGDTIGDADAAKAVGVPFVWVSFGYGKREEVAGVTKVLGSFRQLASVLDSTC